MATIAPAEARASSERDVERDIEKQPSAVVAANGIGAEELKNDSDSSSEKQDGIKQVEAVTLVWSKKWLWSTFAMLWVVCFVMSMLSSVQGSLSPYVTSAFARHGLLATVDIASRIIGGVVTIALAKIIDIRGRRDGFIGAVFLVVIGMIMKAVCQNVETYAAAQVFYWVGYIAIGFVVDVFVADITTLRNRMIIFTLNSTPNLITTFAGPPVAERFYYEVNFRWAFGAFCIILIGFSLPVIAVLTFQQAKAKRMGLLPQRSGRSTAESLKHYAVQFDLPGMLLMAGGFSMLLLPFSLVNASGGNWNNPKIICLIVFGAVLLGLFAAWEKFLAPVPLFPFTLLTDRTIIGVAMTQFLVFLTTFTWNAYYSSYLQVVHDLSITTSNYVLNGYSLTSYFTGPFIALYIRATGQVKWPAMITIPIYLLGTALIIYFRNPSSQVGYLVMCQVLVGFSVGMITTMSQLSLMATVKHQEVAVALAVYSLFGSIGSSTGYAIAGGLWTNILPSKIAEFLPDYAKANATEIFGDINKQLEYPIGHPIRDAVIAAYGDVARKMVISGAALIPLLIISVFAWRNVNVKNIEDKEKSKRGNVF